MKADAVVVDGQSTVNVAGHDDERGQDSPDRDALAGDDVVVKTYTAGLPVVLVPVIVVTALVAVAVVMGVVPVDVETVVVRLPGSA